MDLYLLRHAKSSWESYEDDHERVLSDRGRKDACTLGEYLRKNSINFENTLCSSSHRTRETISIINAVSPHSFDEINYLDSLYHASSNMIKEIIQNYISSNHDEPAGKVAADYLLNNNYYLFYLLKFF